MSSNILNIDNTELNAIDSTRKVKEKPYKCNESGYRRRALDWICK